MKTNPNFNGNFSIFQLKKLSLIVLFLMSGYVTMAQGDTTFFYSKSSFQTTASGVASNGDYISLPTVVLGMSYTVETWFNLSSTTGTNFPFIYSFGGWHNGLILASGGRTLSVRSWNVESNTVQNPNTGFVINPGTWYHLAVVVDGANTKVFVNGNLIREYTNLGTPTDNNTFSNNRIASAELAAPSLSATACQLQEFRIWNNARTANQIRNYFNSRILPNSANLLYYLPFNNPLLTSTTNIPNNTLIQNSATSIIAIPQPSTVRSTNNGTGSKLRLDTARQFISGFVLDSFRTGEVISVSIDGGVTYPIVATQDKAINYWQAQIPSSFFTGTIKVSSSIGRILNDYIVKLYPYNFEYSIDTIFLKSNSGSGNSVLPMLGINADSNYTFSFENPAITGISINSTTGQISWTGDLANNSYNTLTVIATNSSGSISTSLFIFKLDSVKNFEYSQNFEYTFNHLDSSVLPTIQGSLVRFYLDTPSGSNTYFTINNNTGVVKPKSAEILPSGSYNVKVVAFNIFYSDTTTLNILINSDTPTVQYRYSQLTVLQGDADSSVVPVIYNGGDTNYNLSLIGTNIAGISINSKTGVIKWSNAVASGVYNLNAVISNSAQNINKDTATFILTLVGLNDTTFYYSNSSFQTTSNALGTFGDYIELPNLGALANDNFTIETWFNVQDKTRSYQRIFEAGTSLNNNIISIGFLSTQGNLFINNNRGISTASSGVLNNNQWYHIAMVKNGIKITTYLNGDSIDSYNFGNNTNNLTTCKLGASNHTNDATTIGQFQEFRIWKTARTQTEIRNNMNGHLHPLTNCLMYYLPLNQNNPYIISTTNIPNNFKLANYSQSIFALPDSATIKSNNNTGARFFFDTSRLFVYGRVSDSFKANELIQVSVNQQTIFTNALQLLPTKYWRAKLPNNFFAGYIKPVSNVRTFSNFNIKTRPYGLNYNLKLQTQDRQFASNSGLAILGINIDSQYNFSLLNPPANSNFVVNNTSGQISWPANLPLHTYSLTLRVTNNTGSSDFIYNLNLTDSVKNLRYINSIFNLVYNHLDSSSLPTSNGNLLVYSIDSPTGQNLLFKINALNGRVLPIRLDTLDAGSTYRLKIKATNISNFDSTYLTVNYLSDTPTIQYSLTTYYGQEGQLDSTNAPIIYSGGDSSIKFYLVEPVSGITIDSLTGIIRWDATVLAGNYMIKPYIKNKAIYINTDTTRFTLTIVPNTDTVNYYINTAFQANTLSYEYYGDYISLPNKITIDTTLTVEFWTKNNNPYASGASQYPYFYHLTPTGHNNGFNHILFRAADRRIAVTMWGVETYLTNDTLPFNEWVHYAFVVNGRVGKFYINGSLVETITYSGILPSKTIFTYNEIMKGINNEYTPIGSMQDFRIWNVARSDQDIQTNYRAKITPNSKGLIYYLPLNNNTYLANTTNINNGTKLGNASLAIEAIKDSAFVTSQYDGTGARYFYDTSALFLYGEVKDSFYSNESIQISADNGITWIDALTFSPSKNWRAQLPNNFVSGKILVRSSLSSRRFTPFEVKTTPYQFSYPKTILLTAAPGNLPPNIGFNLDSTYIYNIVATNTNNITIDTVTGRINWSSTPQIPDSSYAVVRVRNSRGELTTNFVLLIGDSLRNFNVSRTRDTVFFNQLDSSKFLPSLSGTNPRYFLNLTSNPYNIRVDTLTGRLYFPAGIPLGTYPLNLHVRNNFNSFNYTDTLVVLPATPHVTYYLTNYSIYKNDTLTIQPASIFNGGLNPIKFSLVNNINPTIAIDTNTGIVGLDSLAVGNYTIQVHITNNANLPTISSSITTINVSVLDIIDTAIFFKTSNFRTTTIGTGANGDYINLPTLNLDSSYTVETWFNLNSTTGTIFPFIYSLGYWNSGLILAGGATRILDVKSWDVEANGDNGSTLTGYNIISGTWYHLAVVVNGRNTKVYVNGNLIREYQTLGTPTNNNTFTNNRIANGQAVGGISTTACQLQEFRIWRTARTASEIRNNFNHPINVSVNNLYYYLPLNSDIFNFTDNTIANNTLLVNQAKSGYYLNNSSTVRSFTNTSTSYHLDTTNLFLYGTYKDSLLPNEHIIVSPDRGTTWLTADTTAGTQNWRVRIPYYLIINDSIQIKSDILNSSRVFKDYIIKESPSQLNYTPNNILFDSGMRRSFIPTYVKGDANAQVYFRILNNPVPNAIRIDTLTGVITVDTNTPKGIYSLTVQIRNNWGNNLTNLNLKINTPISNLHYGNDTIEVVYGNAVSGRLATYMGALATNFTLSDTLEGNLSINPTTGSINFTGTYAIGIYQVKVIASNIYNADSVILTIRVLSTVPSISYNKNGFKTLLGDTGYIAVSSLNSGFDPYYRIRVMPVVAGITVDSLTGVFRWNNTVAAGNYPLTITINNSLYSFSTNLILQVVNNIVDSANYYVNTAFQTTTSATGANGDYIILPNLGALANGNFTVETWFNVVDKNRSYQRIFEAGSGEGNNILSIGFQGTNGRIFINNNRGIFSANSNVNNNQWYHVAMVKNGNIVTTYLNGDSIDSYSFGNNNSILTTCKLGASNYYNDASFIGLLKEFRIWNTARTQTQIFNNLNNPISPLSAGLFYYLPLNNNTYLGSTKSINNNTKLANVSQNYIALNDSAIVKSVNSLGAKYFYDTSNLIISGTLGSALSMGDTIQVSVNNGLNWIPATVTPNLLWQAKLPNNFVSGIINIQNKNASRTFRNFIVKTTPYNLRYQPIEIPTNRNGFVRPSVGFNLDSTYTYSLVGGDVNSFTIDVNNGAIFWNSNLTSTSNLVIVNIANSLGSFQNDFSLKIGDSLFNFSYPTQSDTFNFGTTDSSTSLPIITGTAPRFNIVNGNEDGININAITGRIYVSNNIPVGRYNLTISASNNINQIITNYTITILPSNPNIEYVPVAISNFKGDTGRINPIVRSGGSNTLRFSLINNNQVAIQVDTLTGRVSWDNNLQIGIYPIQVVINNYAPAPNNSKDTAVFTLSIIGYQDTAYRITNNNIKTRSLAASPNNDAIILPNNLDFTGSYTIEFWYKCNIESPNYVPIIDFRRTGGLTTGLFLESVAASLNQFQTHTQGSSMGFLFSQPNFSIKNWNHYAFVYNSSQSNLSLFINGILGVTLSNIDQPNNNNFGSNYLGRSNNTSNIINYGQYKEFRFWKTARSQNLIRATSKVQISPISANLYYYLPLSSKAYLTQNQNIINNSYVSNQSQVSTFLFPAQINSKGDTSAQYALDSIYLSGFYKDSLIANEGIQVSTNNGQTWFNVDTFTGTNYWGVRLDRNLIVSDTIKIRSSNNAQRIFKDFLLPKPPSNLIYSTNQIIVDSGDYGESVIPSFTYGDLNTIYSFRIHNNPLPNSFFINQQTGLLTILNNVPQGVYNIEVQVLNVWGTASANYRIIVGTTISNIHYGNDTLNTIYNINDSSVIPSYLGSRATNFWLSNSLNDQVRISASTGRLYINNLLLVGNYAIKVYVGNIVGFDSVTVILRVRPNSISNFNYTPNVVNAVYGNAGSSGIPIITNAGAISYNIASITGGGASTISIQNTTGRIQWSSMTPNGSYIITVTASNGVSSLQTNFTLHVNNIENKIAGFYSGNLQLKNVANNISYADFITLPQIQAEDSLLTIETWFKLEGQGTGYKRIFDFGTASSPNMLLAFNNSMLTFINFTAQLDTPLAHLNLVPSNWNHYAVSLNKAVVKLYINGVLITTRRINSSPSILLSRNYIGRSHYTSNLPTQGSFKEFRIWKSARTDEEVNTYLNSHIYSSEENLYLYLPLVASIAQTSFIANQATVSSLSNTSYGSVGSSVVNSVNDSGARYIYDNTALTIYGSNNDTLVAGDSLQYSVDNGISWVSFITNNNNNYWSVVLPTNFVNGVVKVRNKNLTLSFTDFKVVVAPYNLVYNADTFSSATSSGASSTPTYQNGGDRVRFKLSPNIVGMQVDTNGIVSWNGVALGYYTIKIWAINSQDSSFVTKVIKVGNALSGFNYSPNVISANFGNGQSMAPSYQGTIPIFTIDSGAINGIQVDSFSGIITWNSNVLAGAYRLKIRSANNYNTLYAYMNINIQVVSPSNLSYIPNNFIVDENTTGSSFQPSVNNGGDRNGVFTSSTVLPTGFVLVTTTGVLQWIRPVAGTYNFSINYTNSVGTTTTNLSIVVRGFRDTILLYSAGVLATQTSSLNNSAGDYIQLPKFRFADSNYTIETWFKLDGNIGNSYKRIFDFGFGGASRTYLTLAPNNQFEITVVGNDRYIPFSSANINFNAQNWNHYALVVNKNIGRVYINGAILVDNILINQNPATEYITNFIGHSNNSPDAATEGKWQEFRVWQEARSSVNIASNRFVNINALNNTQPSLVYYLPLSSNKIPYNLAIKDSFKLANASRSSVAILDSSIVKSTNNTGAQYFYDTSRLRLLGTFSNTFSVFNDIIQISIDGGNNWNEVNYIANSNYWYANLPSNFRNGNIKIRRMNQPGTFSDFNIQTVPFGINYGNNNVVIAYTYSSNSVTPSINKGNDDANFSITLQGNNAAGITIDNTTGLLSWTNNLLPNIYNINVEARNSLGTTISSIKLIIGVPISNINYSEDTSELDYGIADSSVIPTVNGSTPRFKLKNAINGLSIDSVSGRLRWTNTILAGNYNIVIYAYNNVNTDSFVYTLIINPLLIRDFYYQDSIISYNVPNAFTSALPNIFTGGNRIIYSIVNNINSNIRIDSLTGVISVSPIIAGFNYNLLVKAQSLVNELYANFILKLYPTLVLQLDSGTNLNDVNYLKNTAFNGFTISLNSNFIDSLQYAINNGNFTTLQNTSLNNNQYKGNLDLSGLIVNKVDTIKIRIKRADNGVFQYSNNFISLVSFDNQGPVIANKVDTVYYLIPYSYQFMAVDNGVGVKPNSFVLDSANYLSDYTFVNSGNLNIENQTYSSGNLRFYTSAQDRLGNFGQGRLQLLALPTPAPRIVNATPLNGGATIYFSHDNKSSNPQADIEFYTVVSNPGNITVTGTRSPIQVTGLDNNTVYRFTVTATVINGIGTSLNSNVSNAVVPLDSVTISTDVVNGSITATKKYAVNSNVTITFTAELGYELDSLIVDGQVVKNSLTNYTFTNLIGNHTIRAVFKYVVLTLPVNNFSIVANDNNCIGARNGSVAINSVANTQFRAILKGLYNNYADTQNFTSTYTKMSLDTGTYSVCITVPFKSDDYYKNCYQVVIRQPQPLTAFSEVNSSLRTITLNLNGSSHYAVKVNDVWYETNANKITMPLSIGSNSISVSTDKTCQGIYNEVVFISEDVIIYPNPANNFVNLYLAGQDNMAQVSIQNEKGMLMTSVQKSIPIDRVVKIDISQYPDGVYFVTLDGATLKGTYKIIKISN